MKNLNTDKNRKNIDKQTLITNNLTQKSRAYFTKLGF
jgi:hypothetical protein